MKRYEEYEDFQKRMINLLMPIAMIQEEVSPKLFMPLANTYLKAFKDFKKLNEIENNIKQEKREAKYRYRLLKKGWRKKIRKGLEKSSNAQAVKGKEGGINSEAVYAHSFDSEPAAANLDGLTEGTSPSAGLIAECIEALPEPTNVENMAEPFDIGSGSEG